VAVSVMARLRKIVHNAVQQRLAQPVMLLLSQKLALRALAGLVASARPVNNLAVY
jgi:hypothetical protein